MKGKRFMAGLLAGMMIIVPINVKAEEALYSTYTFTDMNDLIVSIPANLQLSYSNGVFTGTDSVQVSGTNTSIADYSVDITVDNTNIEYIHESDNTAKATGVVTFGTDGVESWDKDEVADSVAKDISVEVSTFPEVEGKYSSIISYTINVNETLKEDVYFTKTVDDNTMTCEITGLTDAGKAWVISEVTGGTRAVDIEDTTKAAGELKIPEILVVNNKKYTVTSIGANAFKGNTDITSVTMADSVTKLGYAVFYECSNLVTCQLSDNITEWGQADVSSEDVGGSTFWKCTNLTTINIPNGVTVIPRSCFGYCSALKSIEIPANNIELGHQAFAWSGLESINLPEGTIFGGSVAYSTALGKQFYGCASLKTINIPSSVTIISYGAFYGCTSLGNITLPNSISEIGYLAFGKCTSMTSFIVPDSCEKIYNCAFENSSGLTSFSLPIDCNLKDTSGSTNYAPFTGCSNIKDVTYTAGRTGIGIEGNFDTSTTNDNRAPFYCGQSNGTVKVTFAEGVKELPAKAYCGSSNSDGFGYKIKQITLPSTITSISANAFTGLRYVTDIYWNVNSGTVNYASFDKIGYSTTTTLHLGDNITGINRALTAGSSNYSSILNYDTYAKYINYIDWGNSQVTTIKAGQFSGCDLYEVYIPDTITEIGEYAFSRNKNMKTLSVPSSVTTIGLSAFYYCEGLLNIYWDCYNASFSGINASYIFASAGNENAVFHFGDSFQSNGVSGVPKLLFNSSSIDGNGLYSMELKSIDWGTFRPTSLNSAFVMASIIELEIPDSITSIENCAFYGNGKLTTLYIPSSVTSIGKCVAGSTALSDVYYGETEAYREVNLSINTTDIYATEDNSILLNATWHYVETISLSLRAVEEIEIFEDDEIEVIDADLLASFPDLKILTIAKTVKSIEANAFINNTKLETVYYNGSESAWNEISIAEEGNENLFNAEIIFLEEDLIPTVSGNNIVEEPTEEDVIEESTEETEEESSEEDPFDGVLTDETDTEEPEVEESEENNTEDTTLELQEDAVPINSDNPEPTLTSDDLITTIKDDTDIIETLSEENVDSEVN